MPYPVAAVRGKNYGGASYANKVLSYSPIAYWPLNEATGAVATDYSGNGYNGAYVTVTLGQTGIGDGNTCPLFDGTNDYVNIYSAGLAGAFSGVTGTLMIWEKMFNVGVWTDGNTRYAVRLAVDTNNQITINRTTTNNQNSCLYEANNTQEKRTKEGLSDTGWVHYAITWSKTAEEVRVYYGGVQEGVTMTTLGVWAGALHSLSVIIGDGTTTLDNHWYGWLAHCAVWDSVLTPAQIADLAAV